jgi:hypothetical protein
MASLTASAMWFGLGLGETIENMRVGYFCPGERLLGGVLVERTQKLLCVLIMKLYSDILNR